MSPPGSHEQREWTEESALLPKQQKQKRQRTPLPVGQISVLMLGQLAEPVTATCILPFINQMIGEFDITHGDPSKVGYYVGLMVSLFFVAESVTVLWWSRLSDKIGRKPVLLIGLFALTISMILLGFSTSFWPLVFARMLCGAMNGNSGVAKSALGELTDDTNVAQAFALMPITWAVGVTFAPFMGGMLQRPADRFPLYFDTPFWRTYPYLLPCLCAACFSFICATVSFLFFKETLHVDHDARPELVRSATDASSAGTSSPASSVDSIKEPVGNLVLQNIAAGNPLGAASLMQGEPSLYPHAAAPSLPSMIRRGPVPLKDLLYSPGVAIVIANYGALALLDIAYAALNPLVLASPVSLGGLQLDPPTIGLVMGGLGLANGLFQATCFTRVLERLGPRRAFIFGVTCFFPIFACFAGANAVARLTHFGDEDQREGAWLVWALLALQSSLVILMVISYGTIMIYIRSVSPNKRSLGTTNGLAQLLASIVRAIGPAVSTSMYAFSVGHDLLGGYAVYVALIVATVGAVKIALMLPQDVKSDEDV